MREIDIIETLCRGINPVTNQLLDTPRDPEIDKARIQYFNALSKRLKVFEKSIPKSAKSVSSPKTSSEYELRREEMRKIYPNYGKAWTEGLIQQVATDWESGKTLEGIAKAEGRTEASIAAVLARTLNTDSFLLSQENQRRGGAFLPAVFENKSAVSTSSTNHGTLNQED